MQQQPIEKKQAHRVMGLFYYVSPGFLVSEIGLSPFERILLHNNDNDVYVIVCLSIQQWLIHIQFLLDLSSHC